MAGQTLVQRPVEGGSGVWRVGAGLDTVQLVHSYNLPPQQEQDLLHCHPALLDKQVTNIFQHKGLIHGNPGVKFI